MAEYYAPKNFNFWYYFGSLALLVLVNQIVTGIFLTMNYKPSAAEAFASVEYIMRDVNWGWLIRYMHSTGASAFFIVVYLHMFRALMYGSHASRANCCGYSGADFRALMAEGFMGYVLPWGNMSFWGAQVIISLFGSLPVIGGTLVDWIRGDYVIADATLNRFFALHVIAVPLALIFLVIAHLMALHEVGSNNPDGIEIKKHKDAERTSARRHSLSSVLHGEGPGRRDGISGDFRRRSSSLRRRSADCSWRSRTSLRRIPCKLRRTSRRSGTSRRTTRCCARCLRSPARRFGACWSWAPRSWCCFLVPWLDRSPVNSIRYRGPIYKIMLAIFVVSFVDLRALRIEAPVRDLSPARQDLHGAVFRILFADALVHADRPSEAGAGEGHGTWLNAGF